jgi:peptidoglycan LD-endopeptidase LytH
VVHSFAYNEGYGNYGTTIILTHRLGSISFHTLYGHLSRSCIINLEEGANIEKGEVFGEFGIPSDNGDWPPHLHMQIISELDGWSGDYPGVCRFSERDAYLSNCPDPDLILQLNQYVVGNRQ